MASTDWSDIGMLRVFFYAHIWLFWRMCPYRSGGRNGTALRGRPPPPSPISLSDPPSTPPGLALSTPHLYSLLYPYLPFSLPFFWCLYGSVSVPYGELRLLWFFVSSTWYTSSVSEESSGFFCSRIGFLFGLGSVFSPCWFGTWSVSFTAVAAGRRQPFSVLRVVLSHKVCGLVLAPSTVWRTRCRAAQYSALVDIGGYLPN